MLDKELLYKDECFELIGAAMEVHRILGCGFTESVYQDAFENELLLRDIPYVREKTFKVRYKGILLDKVFRTDFVCYNKIIVELKAVPKMPKEFYSQVYNYLKASELQLGLLINFGLVSLESIRVPCTTKWDHL